MAGLHIYLIVVVGLRKLVEWWFLHSATEAK